MNSYSVCFYFFTRLDCLKLNNFGDLFILHCIYYKHCKKNQLFFLKENTSSLRLQPPGTQEIRRCFRVPPSPPPPVSVCSSGTTCTVPPLVLSLSVSLPRAPAHPQKCGNSQELKATSGKMLKSTLSVT